MKTLVIFSLVNLLAFFSPGAADADVVAHDLVAVKGEEVMLRADTKGLFFEKGGVLVEFFVDGKSIGKNLSGSGGVALKPYRVLKTGVQRIKVKSGSDEDEGIILSLLKGSKIVFVDIESGLFVEGTPGRAKPGSRKALKAIGSRYPLVLLQSGMIGARALKLWLQENEYAEYTVVPWNGGAIFDEVNRKGLKIRALVGGPHIIESARKYKPSAFWFDKVDNAEKVKDWETLQKKLK
ncbi:MAG: hypothetical protein NTV99_04135 [Deltaproteobacteria bacterium]|nr:hypothetical protein [Deltaproteobacteria bacterium]